MGNGAVGNDAVGSGAANNAADAIHENTQLKKSTNKSNKVDSNMPEGSRRVLRSQSGAQKDDATKTYFINLEIDSIDDYVINVVNEKGRVVNFIVNETD